MVQEQHPHHGHVHHGIPVLFLHGRLRLAVYRFRGRNLIFTHVLFILMVPLEILMLPLYRLLISDQAHNTYAGVILPSCFPLGVFFFRQYASGLQRDYLDAGKNRRLHGIRSLFPHHGPL
jgi:ABC-type maltose transport system permease subunit